MVEIIHVIAFAMGIVNTFKNKLPVVIVPFISIGIAVVLNILNALLFGGDTLIAGREAFVEAGKVVGLFVAGTIARKISEGTNILER